MSEQAQVHDHRNAERLAVPAEHGSQTRADPRTHQEGGTHYTQMQVQPWDVIDSWPIEQRVGFYRGNAVKYLMRMGSKDAQLQEAKKSRHYLDKLIETLGG